MENHNMSACTGKFFLAGKSHFPLKEVVILKEYLNDFDALCDGHGIEFSVIRGYYGIEDKAPVMLIGVRREDKTRFNEVMAILEQIEEKSVLAKSA